MLKIRKKEEAEGQKQKGNPLGTEQIWRLMLRFGIPAIVSMLINAAYNMIDQVLVGNAVGMLGIAATNIAFPLTTISTGISYLLGSGGASNFNLRLGEGNHEAANTIACNTLSLLAIFGTVIGAAALIFVNPLVYAFGATEAVTPLASTYTAIISIGLTFGIFTTGSCYIIRADGSPRFAMICTVVGAVLNLVVDPIIAFVLKWGIVGLAWSTTIGQMITAGIAVYYFMRKSKTVSVKKGLLWPKLHVALRICSLGIAPCVNNIGVTIAQITMNNTLRYYGAQSVYGSDVPLGSVGAISKLSVVFTAITIGIAMGCQPINSFNYGAKQYGRVKKTLRLALISASVVSVAVFIVFQMFPRELIAIFGEKEPLYVEFAERYLRVFMFMTFLFGVQPVAATFFPSIGKARRGTVISLSRQILFIVPLLIILPIFFGMDGVLYAGPVSDLIGAVISTVFIVTEVRNMSALQRAQAGIRPV